MKKYKYFIIICLLVFIISITGSYAYFAYQATNTTAIVGNIVSIDADLTVERVVGTNAYMVPLQDNALSNAINGVGSNPPCIDSNGSLSCQVYKITLSNNASRLKNLKGTIELYAKSGSGNVYNNLKWQELSTTTSIKNGSSSNGMSKSTLVSDLTLESKETKIWYIAVWISEIDSDQKNTDKGDFGGTVTFEVSNSTSSIVSEITTSYNNATKTSVTTTGGESITQVSSLGLMQDSFGNIRYYGENPNNYVTFNGEEAGWRIIGIFDVEDENGNTEKRIKLIRASSIGSYSYDNKLSGVGSSDFVYGSNDWTDARLMMLLNPGYEQTSSLYAYEGSLYWNRKSGTCYAGSIEGTTSCDFTSTGLTTSAKNMIGQAKYYLGGSSFYAGLYADDYYNFERGTEVYSGHNTTWTGYIGIMYPSDYAYATDLSVCSKDGINYDSDTNCKGKDWLLDTRNSARTIAPNASYSYIAFYVNSSGGVYGSYYVYSSDGERPVLYLKSDVSIASGEGTSTNPYVLSIS